MEADQIRRRKGQSAYEQLYGSAPKGNDDPAAAAQVDFVFAEVWSRPGLGRRDRILIWLATNAGVVEPEMLLAAVRTSITSGSMTIEELHEVALHLGAYLGFPTAMLLRNAIHEGAQDLEIPYRFEAAGLRQAERRSVGMEMHAKASAKPASVPRTPLKAAAYDFVSAEVWSRLGISWRDRRLLSLGAVVRAGLQLETTLHVRTALSSGDLSVAELDEVALQLAAEIGFPRAMILQSIIDAERANHLGDENGATFPTPRQIPITNAED